MIRKTWRIAIVWLLGGVGAVNAWAQNGAALLGFSAAHAQQQQAFEAKFDAMLKRENLDAWLKRLAARPHHVGSAQGKDNAEFMASLFRSWGYQTEIERFDVLFPTPAVRVLEMTGPARFTASLSEPILTEDRTSGQTAEQLPTYNAYSADGVATGELVYVNYGVPKDYEELARRGIDVKGKIVIARYGGSWRGIKPKVAAENGAIGCLIYSDPRDDGYWQGDVYPRGAWRRAEGVQRGSVADMPTFPGDPLTPGVGAVPGAKRLALENAPTLTKIPVLPISYADAMPLLRALGGPVAPEDWRGALPMTYHLGPGPTMVHLKLKFNWDIKPIYNVIARLPGTERPDQWIIRGNHHDAWVNGAEDPISGMVALLEEARGVAEMVKAGWKPKRTIIYAAWDGEEPGLLGSTEWVETHAEELRRKAAVYLNSDSNGRGFLYLGGSHTLEKFINEVARDVTDPQTKRSAFERARALQIVRGGTEARNEARTRPDLRISALGSGSDFTPFLQHIGIASLNLGYGGEDGGGSYHSIYDSIDHYTRFGDPNFDYGIALAQTAGRATMRLANADVLPFSFNNLADTVNRYGREVTKLADTMREDTKTRNALLADGTWAATLDPKEVYILPQPEGEVPTFDFMPLEKALKRLETAARSYDEAQKNGLTLTPAAQKSLDEILYKTERAMTDAAGLPRRNWFQHQIYAPGFYTGYGVKTLPTVREALEQRNWAEARTEIPRLAATLERLADTIERAAQQASAK